MPIKLNGATNGSVELDVPAAVGSDLQVTLPATAGTAIVKATDGSVDLGSVDIDSSGRVGIGTNATSSYSAIADNLLIAGTNTGMSIIDSGDSTQSSLYFYGGTTRRHYIEGGSGGSGILTIQSNNAVKFNIGAAETMRIDSSGNLGLGTDSPSTLLDVRGEISVAYNANYGIRFYNQDRNNWSSIGNNIASGSTAANLAFKDSTGEVMRLAGGRLLVGATAAVSGADANGRLQVSQSVASNTCIMVAENTASSGNLSCIRARFRNYAPNNIYNAFLQCDDSSTNRFTLRSNGGLANYSANNANLSDRNAKKNITAAANTWDRVKEWEIVNYRYKDQPDDADLNLGVIAQQVNESCPEVVTVFQEAKEATETEPAQEERLGVKEQQMHWMAIKALQEAIAKIETLETKVAALEAAP